MRFSQPQTMALRVGAVSLLLAAVVLALFAVFVPGSRGAQVTPALDPAHISLPEPGLFGGSVLIYGDPTQVGTEPSELGCTLRNRAGRTQDTALLDSLLVPQKRVTVAGQELAPLFRVTRHPAGAYLRCTNTTAPVALSGTEPLRGLGSVIRPLAAVLAVVCALIGGVVLLSLLRT